MASPVSPPHNIREEVLEDTEIALVLDSVPSIPLNVPLTKDGIQDCGITSVSIGDK